MANGSEWQRHPLMLGLSHVTYHSNMNQERWHSLFSSKVSEVMAPTARLLQMVPYRITAAGLHGKASLVCGYNAAKGSRQCSRVTWEETVAPQAELMYREGHLFVSGLTGEAALLTDPGIY